MGKEDWVMRIEEDETSIKELDRPQVPMQLSWVTRIRSELGDSQSQSQSHHQQQRPCIYPVPAWLKDLHPGAYEPRMVSIGPYHYGNPKLKPMEKHKHRALLTFLRRAKKNNPEPLDAIKEAMKAVVEQLKSSYEGLDDLSRFLDSKETKESLEERFLQLIIVDGCFILEVLRVTKAVKQKEPTGYEETDPMFSSHGKNYMMEHLRRDMLLLENQLPMLALTTLADAAQTGLQEQQLLNEHVRSFFLFDPTNINTSWDDSLHILHMYIQNMTRVGSYSPTISDSRDTRWSATELREGGVKFSKSESICFTDISFDTSKGILSLPYMNVLERTEAQLLNLMAFEQLHVGAGQAVTAYVNLMDMLIDTARDVELLRNKNIMTGWVGSDETIAKIFNRIAKETDIVMTHNPNGVDIQLSNYRNNKLNRWRASFVHTYLLNPWVFFSLLGALILLFLTVFQDVYTALQYYQSNNSAPPPSP